VEIFGRKVYKGKKHGFFTSLCCAGIRIISSKSDNIAFLSDFLTQDRMDAVLSQK
jgi:hypothetical protein